LTRTSPSVGCGDLAVRTGSGRVAALTVVATHTLGLLWTGSFAWTYAGHAAVFFFFLISGFVIHYRQAQAAYEEGQRGTGELARFALRDFARR